MEFGRDSMAREAAKAHLLAEQRAMLDSQLQQKAVQGMLPARVVAGRKPLNRAEAALLAAPAVERTQSGLILLNQNALSAPAPAMTYGAAAAEYGGFAPPGYAPQPQPYFAGAATGGYPAAAAGYPQTAMPMQPQAYGGGFGSPGGDGSMAGRRNFGRAATEITKKESEVDVARKLTQQEQLVRDLEVQVREKEARKAAEKVAKWDEENAELQRLGLGGHNKPRPIIPPHLLAALPAGAAPQPMPSLGGPGTSGWQGMRASTSPLTVGAETAGFPVVRPGATTGGGAGSGFSSLAAFVSGGAPPPQAVPMPAPIPTSTAAGFYPSAGGAGGFSADMHHRTGSSAAGLSFGAAGAGAGAGEPYEAAVASAVAAGEVNKLAGLVQELLVEQRMLAAQLQQQQQQQHEPGRLNSGYHDDAEGQEERPVSGRAGAAGAAPKKNAKSRGASSAPAGGRGGRGSSRGPAAGRGAGAQEEHYYEDEEQAGKYGLRLPSLGGKQQQQQQQGDRAGGAKRRAGSADVSAGAGGGAARPKLKRLSMGPSSPKGGLGELDVGLGAGEDESINGGRGPPPGHSQFKPGKNAAFGRGDAGRETAAERRARGEARAREEAEKRQMALEANKIARQSKKKQLQQQLAQKLLGGEDGDNSAGANYGGYEEVEEEAAYAGGGRGGRGGPLHLPAIAASRAGRPISAAGEGSAMEAADMLRGRLAAGQARLFSAPPALSPVHQHPAALAAGGYAAGAYGYGAAAYGAAPTTAPSGAPVSPWGRQQGASPSGALSPGRFQAGGGGGGGGGGMRASMGGGELEAASDFVSFEDGGHMHAGGRGYQQAGPAAMGGRAGLAAALETVNAPGPAVYQPAPRSERFSLLQNGRGTIQTGFSGGAAPLPTSGRAAGGGSYSSRPAASFGNDDVPVGKSSGGGIGAPGAAAGVPAAGSSTPRRTLQWQEVEGGGGRREGDMTPSSSRREGLSLAVDDGTAGGFKDEEGMPRNKRYVGVASPGLQVVQPRSPAAAGASARGVQNSPPGSIYNLLKAKR